MEWLWFTIGAMVGGSLGLILGGVLASRRMGDLADLLGKERKWNKRLREKLYGAKEE